MKPLASSCKLNFSEVIISVCILYGFLRREKQETGLFKLWTSQSLYDVYWKDERFQLSSRSRFFCHSLVIFRHRHLLSISASFAWSACPIHSLDTFIRASSSVPRRSCIISTRDIRPVASFSGLDLLVNASPTATTHTGTSGTSIYLIRCSSR